MNSFDAALRLAEIARAVEQLAVQAQDAPQSTEVALTAIASMAREAETLALRLCTLGESVKHELPDE